MIPAEELVWLSEAARPLTVTDVRGYQLANGDSVILLFTTPDFFTSTQQVHSEVFPAAYGSIMAAMQGRCVGTRMLVGEADFGYLVASNDSGLGYVLVGLAQTARLGPSPES